MMLTAVLYVSYLLVAYVGAVACFRFRQLAMLIPLAVLILLTLSSGIRPFVQLSDEEW